MYYAIGVLLAILAGLTNFFGQIIQKKAINDIKKIKENVSMKDLFKNKTWIVGLLTIVVFSTIFLTISQFWIGPALIPGLIASGFIVMAIGSVKILGEKLKKEEFFAIILLIIGIVLISMSRLSIEGDIGRFQDLNFVVRISIVSAVVFILWFSLYYGGKKSKRKPIFMALGAGFPFVIANIWHQPFIITVEAMIKNNIISYIPLFLISGAILLFVNLLGGIHLQKAFAEGNASIVIPMQQIPQQVAPIIIYFLVYALVAPTTGAYFYIVCGIILVTVAGFLLSKRQTELTEITES